MSMVPVPSPQDSTEALMSKLQKVFHRYYEIFTHDLVKRVISELEAEGWKITRNDDFIEPPLQHLGKSCHGTHPTTSHETWLKQAESLMKGFDEGRG